MKETPARKFEADFRFDAPMRALSRQISELKESLREQEAIQNSLLFSTLPELEKSDICFTIEMLKVKIALKEDALKRCEEEKNAWIREKEDDDRREEAMKEIHEFMEKMKKTQSRKDMYHFNIKGDMV